MSSLFHLTDHFNISPIKSEDNLSQSEDERKV